MGEMSKTESDSSVKNPKKVNLLDPGAIKHLLDETVTEIVTSRGYKEDVTMSNVRLLMGSVIIIIALFAQFYPKKFPENRDLLLGCIALYILFNGLLQLIIYTKEKNAILLTYPLAGNAFASPNVVTTSGELCQNPLSHALELVKKVKAKVTEEYVRTSMDFLVLKGRRNFLSLETFVVSDVTWARFMNIDFGWDKAVYGGLAKGILGEDPIIHCYIPAKNNKGEDGILVPIRLPRDAMERFVFELENMINGPLSESKL